MVTTAGLSRAATCTNDCERARASHAAGAPAGVSAARAGAAAGVAGAVGAAAALWWNWGAGLSEVASARIIPVTSQPAAASQWVGLRIIDVSFFSVSGVVSWFAFRTRIA